MIQSVTLFHSMIIIIIKKGCFLYIYFYYCMVKKKNHINFIKKKNVFFYVDITITSIFDVFFFSN